jgi:hypothetical protein
MKRRRPRQHWRRIKTKKGRRRILINKGIRPRKKVKRRRIVKGKRIPAQLHTGANKLKTIINIKGSNYSPEKPKGGFWTSTYTPNKKYDSDWEEFLNTSFLDVKDNLKKRILVRPLNSSKVLQIESSEDMKNLFKKYGYDWQLLNKMGLSIDDVKPDTKKPNKRNKFIKKLKEINSIKKGKINWEDVKKDYDGVRLINPDLLKDWGVESTVWFRNVFRKTKSI